MNVEKEFIIKEVLRLDHENRISVLGIIKKYDPTKVQKFSDGSRIDLDSLPVNIVSELEKKIKTILKLESKNNIIPKI